MIPESIKSTQKFILNDSSLELFLATLVLKHKKIAYFSNELLNIELFRRNISRINSSIKVLEFPDFDCNFFSNLSPTNDIKTSRISTLYNLIYSRFEYTILIGTIDTLSTKTIKITNEDNFKFILKCDNKIKYDEIINFLNISGYEKVDFVHNPGEYSVRGEILDIFSPIYKDPARILFDFDDINKINLFSIDNQLSCKKLENIFYIYLAKFNSKKKYRMF